MTTQQPAPQEPRKRREPRESREHREHHVTGGYPERKPGAVPSGRPPGLVARHWPTSLLLLLVVWTLLASVLVAVEVFP